MHFKLKSTRHTRAGTFKAHIIYTVKDSDHRTLGCVMPLLKGKNAAGKELTKAEVKADLKAVKSLVPKAPKGTLPSIKEPRKVMAALKKSIASVAKLEDELQKAKGVISDITAERDSALDMAETSENARAEAVANLDTASTELATLKAEQVPAISDEPGAS